MSFTTWEASGLYYLLRAPALESSTWPYLGGNTLKPGHQNLQIPPPLRTHEDNTQLIWAAEAQQYIHVMVQNTPCRSLVAAYSSPPCGFVQFSQE